MNFDEIVKTMEMLFTAIEDYLINSSYAKLRRFMVKIKKIGDFSCYSPVEHKKIFVYQLILSDNYFDKICIIIKDDIQIIYTISNVEVKINGLNKIDTLKKQNFRQYFLKLCKEYNVKGIEYVE